MKWLNACRLNNHRKEQSHCTISFVISANALRIIERSKNMLKRIVVTVVFIFAFLNLLGAALDIYLVLYEPNSSITNVYNFSTINEPWQFKSKQNFVLWNILASSLYLLLIILSLLVLRKPKRVIVLLYYVLVAAFIMWSLRYYYLWFKSGFDHNPGFGLVFDTACTGCYLA